MVRRGLSTPAPPSRPRNPRDFTSGPILSALLALALPIVGANILQTVYQLTDTFWLGRIGADAVAAVSLAFPVIFLLISLGGGLAVAGAILIAQHHGRGDSRAVDHVAAQTLGSVFAVSIVLSILGYFLAEPMMRLFGASGTVLVDAAAYLRISFIGLVFLFIYFVFQSLLRGVGDVRTPFLIVLMTVLLNFAADPAFILGWGPIPAMGVAGAAMATVITQGIAAVLGLFILFSGRYGVHLRTADLPPDLPLIQRILALGLPASIEQSTRALGLSIMIALVTGFGTTVVASYGIGTRILSFIIIPALGLSMATSTVVGQNIGAGKIDRAERTATLAATLAFASLTVIGALLFLFAGPLTAAFIPDDADVIAEGARFLRIMALSFGFLGVQQVLAGAFRGAGDTMAAMALAILSLWILRFPLAWILSARTPLTERGIWWAFPVSNVIAAIVAVIWLRRKRWLRRAIAGEEARLQEEVSREALVEEGLG